MKKDTSWEGVAGWYDTHLESDADTYHAKVILPNLTRLLALTGKEAVLDLACGQGYFSSRFAKGTKELVAADLSASLIAIAKRREGDGTTYHVSNAMNLRFAKDAHFDIVYCVLALQNVERVAETLKEVRRVLKKNGRFIFVLNHPAFRIPKHSAWDFDAKANVQFRRVDAYLSATKEKIDMTPGKKVNKEYTLSFHRSLQEYMKLLRAAGFAVTRLEEWISHKKSQPGPRSKAEDTARKEFPLFLAIEAQ